MNRLTEPSTWAGFGILLQVAKAFVPAPYHIILDALSAFAGTIAGVAPEKKSS